MNLVRNSLLLQTTVNTSRILSLGLDLLYLRHSYLQLLRLQKTCLQDSYLATVTAALTKELETSGHILIRAEAHLTTGGIDLLELSVPEGAPG